MLPAEEFCLTKACTGEDALANLSIEKMEDTGAIQGHVRIRSKTQGIALSLGDKITLGSWLTSFSLGDVLIRLGI